MLTEIYKITESHADVKVTKLNLKYMYLRGLSDSVWEILYSICKKIEFLVICDVQRETEPHPQHTYSDSAYKGKISRTKSRIYETQTSVKKGVILQDCYK